ncbi:MAG: c-type cytochrome [Salinisphaera sp.]|nr:c-type cytochrome [Salinisphaera sp.]
MFTWAERGAALLLVLALAACGAQAQSGREGQASARAKAAAPVASNAQAPARKDEMTDPAPSPYESDWKKLGRVATPAEVAAWNIDVRPDFKGLPPGSGSVEEGEKIWQSTCAACHGAFGASGDFFTPLVLGNVTEQDMKTGHVAALLDPSRARTTFMKLSTISTLWDYIHRAMPWNAPKSLSDDQVYAVLAYLLNLAYIVDYDFVLSNETIDEVQAKLPNRNGMTLDHGMWKIDGEPDTHAVACMHDCNAEVKILSSMPDYASGSHGNLAEQMRNWGPYRGMVTGKAATQGGEPATVSAAKTSAKKDSDAKALALLREHGCTACHQMQGKLVGPGFAAVAKKYAGQDDAMGYLVDKIRNGGSGVWGSVAMPAHPNISKQDLTVITQWLVDGGPK